MYHVLYVCIVIFFYHVFSFICTNTCIHTIFVVAGAGSAIWNFFSRGYLKMFGCTELCRTWNIQPISIQVSVWYWNCFLRWEEEFVFQRTRVRENEMLGLNFKNCCGEALVHILGLRGCRLLKRTRRLFGVREMLLLPVSGLSFKSVGKCLHGVDKALLEIYQLNCQRITAVLCLWGL